MEYKNHIPVPPYDLDKVIDYFKQKREEQQGKVKKA